MRLKKKIIISLSIPCFIVILFLCSVIVKNYREAIAMKEQRTAYMEVNLAFHLADVEQLVTINKDIEMEGIYRPLPEVDPEVNRFGIVFNIYMMLLMYELKTGNIIMYEMVVSYFSQEFEPDGSLRLHNNGSHPEISAFVEWMMDDYRWRFEFGDFMLNVAGVYGRYVQRNEENGFIRKPPESLSPQMLRELARAANDREYYLPKMNLTSLQEAGY